MNKILLFVLMTTFTFVLLGCNAYDDTYNMNVTTCNIEQSKVYIANRGYQVLDVGTYNYWHVEITCQRVLTIHLSNDGSNAFEILILSEQDFEKYQMNESFSGYTYNVDVNDDFFIREKNLDSGEYFIVIDNTFKGNVNQPSGINTFIRYNITMFHEAV